MLCLSKSTTAVSRQQAALEAGLMPGILPQKRQHASTLNKAILAKKILEQIENTKLKENVPPNETIEFKIDHVKPKQAKPEPVQTEGEHKPCNCRKSKCLKLYCECFANNKYCGPACSCSCCNNTPAHDHVRLHVKQQILMRNPQAFRPKLDAASEMNEMVDEHVSVEVQSLASQDKGQEKRHFKGCNCRRSNC